MAILPVSLRSPQGALRDFIFVCLFSSFFVLIGCYSLCVWLHSFLIPFCAVFHHWQEKPTKHSHQFKIFTRNLTTHLTTTSAKKIIATALSMSPTHHHHSAFFLSLLYLFGTLLMQTKYLCVYDQMVQENKPPCTTKKTKPLTT